MLGYYGVDSVNVSMAYQPTQVEIERQRRIKVAVCAYAYEFLNVSLMSDHEYDALSLNIDPTIDTGDMVMDIFFLTEFIPSTGVWIHNHPKIEGVKQIYEKVFA